MTAIIKKMVDYRNYAENQGGQDQTAKATWNFDQGELMLIFEIKYDLYNQFKDWNLEKVYWALRDLRRELDAKLSEREKEKISKSLSALENARQSFNAERTTKKSMGDFFTLLENFYMELCDLMQEHGIYFRESEDDVGL